MNRLAAAVAVAVAIAITLARSGPLCAQPTDPPPKFDDAVPPAAGAPITADDWLRVGLARYDSGDWKGAVDAFQMGNRIDPRPQFLFAIAQAERRRGDCASAVAFYDKFLAASPPIEQADAAREQMHKCEAAVLSTAPAPAPKPEPRAVRIVVRQAPPPPRGRSWLHDPWTDGALAGTATIAAVGVGLWIAANTAATAAAAADTYDRHLQLQARADRRDRDATICASLAAIGGAVAVWRIVHHGGWTREHLVQVGPGPGTGVALGGRF